jgi:RHS repeat-associated protein
VPLPQRDETIETVEYSDGFGRLLQTRTQAEDILFGDLSFGGGVLSADQSIATGDAVGRRRGAGDPPNVIVSGWQVYDNKGRVVEKYEPFFDVGWDYEPPGDAQLGQKVTMFYDPRGQVIRTLNPDGSEQRVIYGIPVDLTKPEQFAPTPWEAYTYDPNDLAPVSFHPTARLPDGSPKPLTDRAPATHHFTPSDIMIDALGRTVLAVARNRDAPQNPGDPLPPIQEIRTQTAYDIRGNVLTVTDALDRVAFRYTYDLANQSWRIESIDAGLRRMVVNVLGNETERRDSKGALILQAYDRLQRPTRLWARDDAGGPITLRQRMEYGDAGKPAQTESERLEREAMRARNLLGRLHRHHDEAGLTTVAAVDFKGNVLDTSRRVIADAPILAVFEQAVSNGWQVTPFQVDWEPGPQETVADREGELLETTVYQTTASYDALNRIKRMQLPQDVEGRRRELRPEYNRAGGLEQVWLDETLYVERIAYDAKGQRALIAHGNGVMSRYAYDPHTFRLMRLRSERYTKSDDLRYHPGGEALQDFGYAYDLVGNIVGIRDRAPGSGIPNNPEALAAGDPVLAQLLVSGNALNRRFEYDPIYRLRSATGRECDRPPDGPPWDVQPRCTDLTRSRAYTEHYHYDAMGNLERLEHGNGPAGGFVRKFSMETDSNRLRELEVGGSTHRYAFDANGNMRSETTSRHFEWNHADQMKAFRTQTDGAEPSVHAHYLYDAAGQRVKKLVRKQGGQSEVAHYIAGVFEHHRWAAQSQGGENNHVHVMDDTRRVALLRFGAAHPDDRGPAVQFQLGDHLGSSNVVASADGVLTSREEFTSYGETSFGSFARKRYRFTGMERDEESGLNYHSARYYVAWTMRWIAADPLGAATGLNAYVYAHDNPMNLIDRNGLDTVSPEQFRNLASDYIDVNNDISISDDEFKNAFTNAGGIVESWANLVAATGPGQYKLGKTAEGYVHAMAGARSRMMGQTTAQERSPGVYRTLSVEDEFRANMKTNKSINLLNVGPVLVLEAIGRDSRNFLRQTAPLTDALLAAGMAGAEASYYRGVGESISAQARPSLAPSNVASAQTVAGIPSPSGGGGGNHPTPPTGGGGGGGRSSPPSGGGGGGGVGGAPRGPAPTPWPEIVSTLSDVVMQHHPQGIVTRIIRARGSLEPTVEQAYYTVRQLTGLGEGFNLIERLSEGTRASVQLLLTELEQMNLQGPVRQPPTPRPRPRYEFLHPY